MDLEPDEAATAGGDGPDEAREGAAADKGARRRQDRLPKGAQVVTGANGETLVVRQTSVLHDLVLLLLKISIVILAFVLVFTFLFGLFRTTSSDMVPNVNNGDLVMYYRLDKNYVTGDLTLVNYQGETQVRRVVASAGDCVLIDGDGLKVNGALQQEPKIADDETTQPYEDGIHFTGTCPSGEPGVGVGEGEVFVLADARTNGVDSRMYGPVRVADTLGKVNLIFRFRQF